MKSVRGIAAIVFGVLAALPAWAAVEITDSPTYTQGVTSAEGCAWEASRGG